MPRVRLAITADSHWGLPKCQPGNLALVEALRADPPDLLLLGGDQGADSHFDECLEAFGTVGCPVALVPGNHDIWVREADARGDSLDVYRDHLPNVCRRLGMHLLDTGPFFLPGHDLAVVGCMNWYDHSWGGPTLVQRFPAEAWRLEAMQFSRGRHNDRVYVRWPAGLDGFAFTRQGADTLESHLREALERASSVVVMTHHPALPELGFPWLDRQPSGSGENAVLPDMNHLMWEAFSGNTQVERLLRTHADRLALVISGHTHRWREGALPGGVRLLNVGSDYPVKNLIRMEGLTDGFHLQQFGEMPANPAGVA